MIFRGQRYAPHLANYAGAAGGRTFPSSAGFETSKTFFTDDEGVYLVEMRDAPAFAERSEDGSLNLDAFVDNVRQRTQKVQDGRLGVPSELPFTEAHNTWVFNKPSTLVVIPVADLSQHVLMGLCYMLQNGLVLYDDIHGRAIPGIERFKDIVDVDSVWPITFAEQSAFAEVNVEIGASCYAGALMLQAMGLGGWMYNGVDPFAVLGSERGPAGPGLGLPLRHRRALALSEPYGSRRGHDGLLSSPLSRHAGGRRGGLRAQVRPRGAVPPGHTGALERQSARCVRRLRSTTNASGSA